MYAKHPDSWGTGKRGTTRSGPPCFLTSALHQFRVFASPGVHKRLGVGGGEGHADIKFCPRIDAP